MSRGIGKIELYGLVFLLTLCATVFALPRMVLETAGRGAWLPIAASLVPGVLGTLAIIRLGLYFPGERPVKYLPQLIGRPLALAVILVWAAGVLVTAIVDGALVGKAIALEYFTVTPLWFILLVVVSVAGYLAGQGLERIARLVPLLGLAVLASALVTLFLVRKNIHPGFVLPLWDPVYLAHWPSPSFIGAVGSCRTVGVLLFVTPFLRCRGGMWWGLVLSVLLGTMVIFLFTTALIMIFGVGLARHFSQPVVMLLSVARAEQLPLERLEFLLFWGIMLGGLVSVAAALAALGEAVSQLTGADHRLVVALAVPAVIVASLWWGRPEIKDHLTSHVFASNTGFSLASVLLWGTAWVKRRRL